MRASEDDTVVDMEQWWKERRRQPMPNGMLLDLDGTPDWDEAFKEYFVDSATKKVWRDE